MWGGVDSTQLLKGVLDLVVLAAVRDRDGYGYDIVRRLKDSGVRPVGHASVYGSLRRLHVSGHLRTYDLASETGPRRRYYALTDAGRAELDTGGQLWREFTGAVDRLLQVQVTNR